MFGYVRHFMRKQKYKKESFDARIQMEKDAQRRVAARLTRLELAYKIKTRIK